MYILTWSFMCHRCVHCKLESRVWPKNWYQAYDMTDHYIYWVAIKFIKIQKFQKRFHYFLHCLRKIKVIKNRYLFHSIIKYCGSICCCLLSNFQILSPSKSLWVVVCIAYIQEYFLFSLNFHTQTENLTSDFMFSEQELEVSHGAVVRTVENGFEQNSRVLFTGRPSAK